MIEGNLYEIKPQTIIEETKTDTFGTSWFPVLKGWRQWDHDQKRPPFIYLGYKHEDWRYNYQGTNKIHYILWKEDIYVMDNQFAKHVIPVWENADGQD